MKPVSSYRDTREAARGPNRGRDRSASPDAGRDRRRNVADEKARPEDAERTVPPLPHDEEPPPLPSEPTPAPEDDGWDWKTDPTSGQVYFYNHFTGVSQWENPRVPSAAARASYGPYDRYAQPTVGPATTAGTAGAPGTSSPSKKPRAGGYNPAIHGNFDPKADYAKIYYSDDEEQQEEEEAHTDKPGAPADSTGDYTTTMQFNRWTGRFQKEGYGPEYHNDENKSRRQMSNYFDVDAAANSYDGRSLKEERSEKAQRLSWREVKAFKERNKQKKERKQRAWLMS